MSRVHLLGLGLAITSLTVAGCDDGRSECELGDTQACTCPDGTAGTQICTAAGELSDCMCGTPMIDAGPGMDAGPGTDAGRDAGGDAGPDVDSAIVIMVDGGDTDAGADSDGGTTDTDGGTTDTDGGTTDTDGGTTGTDGGTTGTDGGTTGTDSGTTITDAGLCGNSICDTGAGETNANCPADCLPAMCTAVGQACGAGAQPSGFICIGGVCEATCTVGGTACATGVCDTGGYCRRSECTSFFDDDCVAANRDCIPVGNGTNWCIPNGAGTANAPCTTDSECGDGLVCGGVCFAPECAPTGGATCGGGQTCTEVFDPPRDLGICTCTPFTSGTCPSGEWCVPSTGTEGLGFCGPEGAGSAGAPCAATSACAAGLICVGAAGSATCEPVCYPSAGPGDPGDCASGACVELVSGGESLAVGICDSAVCNTFTSGECASGEWCVPFDTDARVGQCSAQAGAAGEFESCAAQADCQAGLICLGDGAGGAACLRMCNPHSTAGATGDTCSGATACYRFIADDGAGGPDPLAWGYCDAIECGFHEGSPTCAGASDVCIQGEAAWGQPADLCVAFATNLAPEANCVGLTEGALCAPSARCFDIGAGLRCYDYCAVSEGAFGTVGHPDCRNASATCVDAFISAPPRQDPSYGLCLP